MNQAPGRAATRWVTLGLLGLLFVGALAQRTVRVHEAVFPPGEVLYQGIDAWYHARLITHAAVTGERLRHDPHLRMPDGAPVAVGPLFDDLGAWAARLTWGGRSARGDDEGDLLRVRRVAAWLPAVLGALIIVPVVFLARSLWGPAAGWIAGVGYLAVPGQILSRSVLGATDHHVGEVFFSTLCFAGITLSLQRLSHRHLSSGIGWAALAGFALGAYQLTWIAGMLLPIVLLGWLGSVVVLTVMRSASERGRASQPSRLLLHVACTTAIASATALALVTPQVDGVRVLASGRDVCLLLLLASLVVIVGHRLVPVRHRGLSIAALVTTTAIVGTWLVLRFDVWSQFSYWASFLRPRVEAGTVREAAPLLSLGSSWGPVWNELGMGWLVAMPGLLLLGFNSWRNQRHGELLLLIWSSTALLMTLAQNRFGYYLGVVSILAATCCLASIGRSFRVGVGPGRARWASLLFALGVVFVFVAPNIRRTTARTALTPSIPGAWLEALDWIESQTPDPFGGHPCRFVVEDPACRATYGVFTWWDYGYWLIERGRRVPFSNPTQAGAATAARILLSDADGAAKELAAMRADFLIVDAMMGMIQPGRGVALGKFHAIATWSDFDRRTFSRLARMRNDAGDEVVTTVYFPRYFESLVGRVASHGTSAAEPMGTALIVFQDDPDLTATDPIEVDDVTWFTDFDRARIAVESLSVEQRRRARFASFDPLQTPVPLPALSSFEEVFRSRDAIAKRSDGDVPRVRVLQRTGARSAALVSDLGGRYSEPD